MLTKKFTITNDTGLHSRPADLFVRTAKLFTSDINVIKDDKTVNAKNIVKVILLNANNRSVIELQINGEDEEAAMQAMTDLIESEFEKTDSRIEI